MKERLEIHYFPLLTRASKYLKELDEGAKSPEITNFIRKEMIELNPGLLHGKSMEERHQGKKKSGK